VPLRHIGVVEVLLHALLTSALDGRAWSFSRPGHFTPGAIVPSIHWIRGWAGQSDEVSVAKTKKPIFDPAAKRKSVVLFSVPSECL